jgi:serine/threonine-protein kinase RsbW
MPYYRCPACALTVHSAAGRFTANLCPNCGAPLHHSDRVHIEEHHPAAITRRFPATRRSVITARRELERLLWALDQEEFQTLSLLVSELISNSVRHSGARVGSMIRMDVVLTEGTARVEVRDDGHGFTPVSRTNDSPLDGKWGLHLLDRLADRWGVGDDPHTLVWFELDRQPVGGDPQKRSLRAVPPPVSAGLRPPARP